MEHASLTVQILLPLISVIIVATILMARRRQLFIRRIQGLTAIDEAIGRATEMGRPMLCCPGLGGIDVPTLQALSIITYIVRASARFGTRVIVPVSDPTTFPIIEEAIRDAYVAEGRPEQFNSNDIRFLSNRQFAYAASVAGLIWREQVASCFLFGLFYAESLIFAETGQQVGAIQVAGTPSTTQIPFFIAACDYVIIGDEFYAASAYLSREPTLLGSLVGQDICKGILILLVLIGAALVSLAPLIGPPAGQWFFKLFQ
ncbi:MAG TPA: DUF6754 domain-containing protein [Chthonomonadaceae bacterium]|nr:DUF6754 domain-containing protein [Chthonomonadaceae bacterium]